MEERLVKHSLTISTIGLKFAAENPLQFIKCGGEFDQQFMKSGCRKVPRRESERFLKIVAVLGYSRVAYYMETCVRLHFNNKSLMEFKEVLLRQQNKKDKVR
jgi:hypothetical protein